MERKRHLMAFVYGTAHGLLSGKMNKPNCFCAAMRNNLLAST